MAVSIARHRITLTVHLHLFFTNFCLCKACTSFDHADGRTRTTKLTSQASFAVITFNSFSVFSIPPTSLSPLPSFPTVHAPVESPISTYMHDL
ncbi:hypothetical protein JHK87_050328 [Glycine soja]|nr:hypothetical protein JHK87_050328 [Glycine soja]